MDQKLYAFWKYDLFPYLLGGEVVRIDAGGYVEPLGYGKMKVKPLIILPFERGEEIMRNLQGQKGSYKVEKDRIQNLFIDSIVRNFPDHNSGVLDYLKSCKVK